MEEKMEKKAGKGGDMVRVKFVNMESPGVDIRFNFEGKNYGPLSDGETCDLPWDVVEHLNGLSVPRMEFRPDPETGQARSAMTGRTHRFSCVPVSLRSVQAPV